MYINHKKSGLTIVEVLVSFVIIFIILTIAIGVQTNIGIVNRSAKDRAFAGQKAVQMMEELKSLSQAGETADDNLDKRSNGANLYSAILTTEKLKKDQNDFVDSTITSDLPSSSTSGNYIYNGNWKFLRNVTVARIPGDSKARKVTIKVYATDSGLKPLEPALAQLSSILKTIANPNTASQVIDTYPLAISNIPGWWLSMPEMKTMYDSIMFDLRDKNLGLDFKSHYITVGSYGRDFLYAPYITDNALTESDTNSTYAYFYPGKIKNTDASNRIEYYYSPDDLAGVNTARILTTDSSNALNIKNDFITSVPTNGSINTLAYPIADQFNNAMRYPDELAMYTRLNSLSKQLKGEDEGRLEPTYRLLMEDMNSTKSYRNAIIANLHGELFPFIPLRNYSDAAKDMVKTVNLGIRAVTHPERINYDNTFLGSNQNKVNLRVYAYNRLPNDASASTITEASYLEDPITVFIPFNNKVGEISKPSQLKMPDELTFGSTATLTNINNYLTINYIEGNPTTGSIPQTNYNIWRNQGPALAPGNINIDPDIAEIIPNPYFDYDGDGTSEKVSGLLIKLKGRVIGSGSIRRIPTIADRTGGSVNAEKNKGLNQNKELYGMDYIPTPLANTATGFDNVFTSSATSIPTPTKGLNLNSDVVKNTARFVISIDVTNNADNPFAKFLDNMMTIETRIGDDLNTGTRMDGTLSVRTGVASTTSTSSSRLTKDEIYSRTPNLSRTYVWIGNAGYQPQPNLSMSMPWTEKFQITGDPRYNPYKDVLDDMGYNVAFLSSGGLTTIDTSSTGYNVFNGRLTNLIFDNVNNDVPRMFQLFRSGLLNSNATYTSMVGWTHYYYGVGGEIGLDTENPQDFTINKKPFNTGSGFVSILDSTVNEIINGSTYIVDNSNNWFCLPSIGELYPDNVFASQWLVRGNLTSPGFFRSKLNASNFNIKGTTSSFYTSNINKRLQNNGAPALINGGSQSGKYFNHSDIGTIDGILTRNSGSLIALGDDLNKSTGTFFEDTKANRPFLLDSNTTPPNRSTGSVVKSIYDSQNISLSFLNDSTTINNQSTIYRMSDNSRAISAIIKGYQNAGGRTSNTPGNRFYFVSNGLKEAGSSGKMPLAKLGISAMLYSFLRTADIDRTWTSDNYSIPIPYIGLTSNNLSEVDDLSGETPAEGFEITTSSIPFEFVKTWKKWDMTKYSDVYSDTWEPATGTIDTKYQIMYSKDGKKWFYPDNSTQAFPSIFKQDKEITPVSVTASDPVRAAKDITMGIKRYKYTYDISSLERDQSYIFRLEAYRYAKNNVTNSMEYIGQHYSYHQREYFIK